MPVAVENDINMEGSPEAPKSLTLQEELQRALSQETLSFTGNYYHAQLLWSAPNPCLSISRLGPIGLPLVEDYAKRIISVARSSHEQCGTSGTAVHGIWEIDPTQISFLNPTWDSYISNTLCRDVCTALGASTSAPKMELRRLLLFEEGANCSAHNGLQGTDGIFATVTIFLPSAYSGGQIVLSTPSNTTTIDFAADSAYASAVLAMYTDTAQEVRPISSGYCLALSYNLIHTTSSTEPCPSPPKAVEAASLLRIVLRKWRGRLDSYETEQYRTAYLLDHTYDLKDVKDVATSLKGVDGYRVRILSDVAKELGFTLGVGSLEYTSGEISNVLKDATILKQLTGLDGEPLFGLTKPMKILKDSVIMVSEITSKAKSSPKSKHDGGPDIGGKRSVLLLIDGKHHDDVRFEVEGLPVAVQVLRETWQIPPTRENIKWAKHILQQSKRNNKEYTEDTFRDMLNYSMDWEDIELWKQSTDSYLWDFDYVHSDLLFKAYRTFPFDKIRSSFSKIMDNSSLWCDDHIERPGEIITFLHTLSGEAAKDGGRETVQSWCKGSVKQVLRRCSPEKPLHAESVLRVIRLVGMRLCGQYMLPDLIDRDHERYFGFWIALHTLLRDQRQSLLEDLSKSHPDPHVPTATNSVNENEVPKTARSTTDVLNDLINISLCIPSITWFKEQHPYTSDFASFVFGCPRAKFNPIPGRIDRLVSVLDACVRSSDASLCESVLEQSLETSGNPMWYLAEFYTPVISRVRDLLASLGQEISQPPFFNFLRKLIGRCLSQVLGKRGPVVDIGLRKLSCEQSDCATCKKLDAFILSIQPEIQLHMDPKDCYHAEGQLEDAIDLCTYERPGEAASDRFRSRFGKQTLEIKKHESVVRCSSWDYRLSMTNAFLESIGSDSLIEGVMGDRYADVQAALTGRRQFVWDSKRDAQAQAVQLRLPDWVREVRMRTGLQRAVCTGLCGWGLVSGADVVREKGAAGGRETFEAAGLCKHGVTFYSNICRCLWEYVML